MQGPTTESPRPHRGRRWAGCRRVRDRTRAPAVPQTPHPLPNRAATPLRTSATAPKQQIASRFDGTHARTLACQCSVGRPHAEARHGTPTASFPGMPSSPDARGGSRPACRWVVLCRGRHRRRAPGPSLPLRRPEGGLHAMSTRSGGEGRPGGRWGGICHRPCAENGQRWAIDVDGAAESFSSNPY
jgi:hypothetical protein